MKIFALWTLLLVALIILTLGILTAISFCQALILGTMFEIKLFTLLTMHYDKFKWVYGTIVVLVWLSIIFSHKEINMRRS